METAEVRYVLQEQLNGNGPWTDLYWRPILEQAEYLKKHWEGCVGPARIIKRTTVTTVTDEVVEN